MALIVQKFGGTSVGSVERIEQVADKVKKFRDAGDDLVVVLSAMSGETNRLIDLAKAISGDQQPLPRELDVIVSTGEQVTIALLAMALNKRGVPAVSYTGSQVRILTDSAHTKARILQNDDQKIRTDLKAGRVVVVAGFQGVDEHGNITTLGRGGSDTTGVALACAGVRLKYGAACSSMSMDVMGPCSGESQVLDSRSLSGNGFRSNAGAKLQKP